MFQIGIYAAGAVTTNAPGLCDYKTRHCCWIFSLPYMLAGWH